MTDSAPTETRRLDYRPPAFLLDTVDLRFELDPDATLVRSRLVLRRNPAHGDPAAPLHLDGEALTLLALRLDGEELGANQYTLEHDGSLTIPGLPDTATLEVETRIAPAANTELSGLYTSGGAYFTQCEAEGFRRITFFPDRPDVLARYTNTIVADAALPVLLSNGNPGEAGNAAGRAPLRHLDRSAPQTVLFVCARRRRPGGRARPLHHTLRPRRGARHLGPPRR